MMIGDTPKSYQVLVYRLGPMQYLMFAHKIYMVYQPKISGILAITKKISADISIPKKYFHLLSFFIKVVFIYFFLHNDCLSNTRALQFSTVASFLV